MVPPIDALVSEHEGVNCVALLHYGCRCAHFSIEDSISHVLMASQHLTILFKDLNPNLQHTSYILYVANLLGVLTLQWYPLHNVRMLYDIFEGLSKCQGHLSDSTGRNLRILLDALCCAKLGMCSVSNAHVKQQLVLPSVLCIPCVSHCNTGIRDLLPTWSVAMT